MEYLVDPDAEEEYQPLEIDPGLLFRKDHLSWLFCLVNSIATEDSNALKSDSLHFCVNCSRYLTHEEDVTSHRHQPAQGPHHVFPLMRVHSKEHGKTKNYYVSVQALVEIHVPIGDVLSHVLPDPARSDAVGDVVCRCLYVQPRKAKKVTWLGDVNYGRCAYRECEKVFSNRQSHLRLYGVTPQFCSISCKLQTWLCCNNCK